MFKIGVDLGYGFVKAVSEMNRSLLFPSVVGTGRERQLKAIFGGSGKDYEIVYNGERYFVGDLALTASYDATRAFEEARYEHYSTPILMATAVALLALPGVPVHLGAGLPLSYFVTHKDRYENLLREMRPLVEIPKVYQGARRLNIGEVTLFPQAAGALYSHIFDENGRIKNGGLLEQGGMVGVVDIGYKTTDYLLMDLDGFEVLQEMSGTLNLGMSDVYKAMQSYLQEETGSPVDLLQVEASIGKGLMWFKGRKYDVEERGKEIGRGIAQAIADRLRLSWRDRRNFLTKLFVAGGGATMLGPYLNTGESPLEILPAPQFANARGFLALAVRREKT